MPKRDPKTGRFFKSADTGNTTDAGSDVGMLADADSATGKNAVGIQHTTRRRVRGRVVIQRMPAHA